MTLRNQIHALLLALPIMFICTIVPTNVMAQFPEHKEVYDPLEGYNRFMFEFNDWADKLILKPLAQGYRYVVPEPGREAVHNVVTNLGEPITFANALLQGDIDYSMTTLMRFTVNSTIGIGGIFVIVEEERDRREDFGQTLGHYGMGPGPYIVLPILGPSNARDAVGLVADAFTDPFNYLLNDYGRIAKAGITGLDKRESLLDLTEEIEQDSFDPYATYRSLYMQRRADEIINGGVE